MISLLTAMPMVRIAEVIRDLLKRNVVFCEDVSKLAANIRTWNGRSWANVGAFSEWRRTLSAFATSNEVLLAGWHDPETNQGVKTVGLSTEELALVVAEAARLGYPPIEIDPDPDRQRLARLVRIQEGVKFKLATRDLHRDEVSKKRAKTIEDRRKLLRPVRDAAVEKCHTVRSGEKHPRTMQKIDTAYRGAVGEFNNWANDRLMKRWEDILRHFAEHGAFEEGIFK